MTIIYWFRRDRRLSDNPALSLAIAKARDIDTTLLPVALREENPEVQWGFKRLGSHRLAFEDHSLDGLARDLRSLGSDLYQPQAPGMAGLIKLAKEVRASCIICEAIEAPQELDEIDALRTSSIEVHCIEQSALLPDESLPFHISNTPTVFSEFRRQVEAGKSLPREPLPCPKSLPPLPENIPVATPHQVSATLPALDRRSAFAYQSTGWHGHATDGFSHLQRYFAGALPRRYKESRNGLIGSDYSTKFSPWLSVGAISAAQIWQTLKTHEDRHGANDSTYWIWFELLWRDHFRLMMRRFGRQLFLRKGLSKQPSAQPAHHPAKFDRWRTGNTGHDFIDAAMRELSATGYLSNRMRQVAASYLIHDLDGDWRAGAAWFEHCLIDFDVHSNQGNWAYIAGVGTDPRGGRRFNPDKQARDYDSDGSYRKLWSVT